VLTGKTLPLHGGGTSVRSFIYGSDIASAIDSSISLGRAGNIYHFSSPPFISIKNLVMLICELMEYDSKLLIEPAEDRPSKDNAYLISSKKAYEFLGWTHKVDLKDGLAQTIAHLSRNIDYIKTLDLEYSHES